MPPCVGVHCQHLRGASVTLLPLCACVCALLASVSLCACLRHCLYCTCSLCPFPYINQAGGTWRLKKRGLKAYRGPFAQNPHWQVPLRRICLFVWLAFCLSGCSLVWLVVRSFLCFLLGCCVFLWTHVPFLWGVHVTHNGSERLRSSQALGVASALHQLLLQGHQPLPEKRPSHRHPIDFDVFVLFFLFDAFLFDNVYFIHLFSDTLLFTSCVTLYSCMSFCMCIYVWGFACVRGCLFVCVVVCLLVCMLACVFSCVFVYPYVCMFV